MLSAETFHTNIQQITLKSKRLRGFIMAWRLQMSLFRGEHFLKSFQIDFRTKL